MTQTTSPSTDENASPSAQLNRCSDVIIARENDIKAFVDLDLETASATAQSLDKVPDADRKQLHGIPTAIKEIVDVAGMTCAWGSPAHAGRKAIRDAAIVADLKSAGANIVGTTVSTEYAIASAGPTRNPHDLSKTPGGSSSGSAAAVGAGMVDLAIGTQTIGSIVRPALYCGAKGFKLGHDSVSMDGVMPLQPILDHIGLLARDWSLIDRTLDAFGLPIGETTPVRRCYFVATGAPLSDAVIDAREIALRALKAHGFEIVDAIALSKKRSQLEEIAHELTSFGLLDHHVRDFNATPDLWSDTAKRLLTEAQSLSHHQIDEMIEACTAARNAIADVTEPGDIFLSDAIDDVAPDWAADKTGNNRLQGLWSVLGLPTATWSTGVDARSGLPVGVQISAPLGSDRWLAQLMIKLGGG